MESLAVSSHSVSGCRKVRQNKGESELEVLDDSSSTERDRGQFLQVFYRQEAIPPGGDR
jgi:hypothetical protein